MGCAPIELPGGVRAIVCTRGAKQTKKCGWCSKPSAFQCDWKTDKDGHTCDAHICAQHAQHVGESKDLCPVHQKAYEQWKERRQPSTS